MTIRVICVLLAASMMCGCGGKKPEPTPPVDHCKEAAKVTPILIIGSGEDRFETIESDSLLTPTTAGQGGHHIWASIKVTGINPGEGMMLTQDTALDGGYVTAEAVGEDPVLLTAEISLPDTTTGPFQMAYDTFLDGDSQSANLTGITAILNVWTILADHEGVESIPATLFVSVADSCGTVVSDRKEFQLGLVDIPGLYGTGYY